MKTWGKASENSYKCMTDIVVVLQSIFMSHFKQKYSVTWQILRIAVNGLAFFKLTFNMDRMNSFIASGDNTGQLTSSYLPWFWHRRAKLLSCFATSGWSRPKTCKTLPVNLTIESHEVAKRKTGIRSHLFSDFERALTEWFRFFVLATFSV